MREIPTVIGTAGAIIGLILLISGLFTSNFSFLLIKDASEPSQHLGLYEQLTGILFIIIGLITAIVGLITPEKGEKQKISPNNTAIDNPALDNSAIHILMTRYAKGEITKNQYETMKVDLEKMDYTPITQQEVKEKTGKPIAAGILLVISASLSLIAGILYMFIFFLSWSILTHSLPAGAPEIISFYLLITIIFDILAFSLGLAGGICSFKRNNFSIAIIGVSFVIVGACLTIFLFFLSIPILVLGILSAVFIGISKKEFN